MGIIAGVVVAVKDWSEETQKRISSSYGNLVNVELIDNSKVSSGAGICAKYNAAIEKIIGDRKADKNWCFDNSWVVFSHDDIVLKSSNQNICQALLKVADKADVACVAGTTQIPPLDPGYWWKGLTEPGFRGSGSVIHRTPDTDDMFHIESYGPYPQQVAAFDGLWFAVKLRTLIEKPDLRFDESYPGYHYYDADFATTARSLGCDIWTVDIQILHDKWGRGMEDPSFKEHQKIFVDKWSKKKHLYYKGAPAQRNNSFVGKTGAFK